MFENPTPPLGTQIARVGDDDALRTLDWGELLARLEAARDLRQALNHDAGRSLGQTASDFAAAAAQYFRTRQDCEADVNPVALGQFKGSTGMVPEDDGLHANEARIREPHSLVMRETLND